MCPTRPSFISASRPIVAPCWKNWIVVSQMRRLCNVEVMDHILHRPSNPIQTQAHLNKIDRHRLLTKRCSSHWCIQVHWLTSIITPPNISPSSWTWLLLSMIMLFHIIVNRNTPVRSRINSNIHILQVSLRKIIPRLAC